MQNFATLQVSGLVKRLQTESEDPNWRVQKFDISIVSQERNSVQIYNNLIPLIPQQARACSCLLRIVPHDCRLYVSHC